MAENLMNYDDMRLVRFQCDCLSPRHSLEVIFEDWLKDGGARITIEFNSKYEPKRIWDRLVRAFRILRGKEIFDHDFCFRTEDAETLAQTLKEYANAAKEANKAK